MILVESPQGCNAIMESIDLFSHILRGGTVMLAIGHRDKE